MTDQRHGIQFYKDEVRCGFYVPTAIKQAWAASLIVLGEIDRICLKYKIEYFADWGTLLGTVRHGGFVPWDDDLDICMKREDYRRFREIADRELPTEYVIHDYERQEDHWLFLARVCNSKYINYSKEHLDKYNNFPYISGIDIFIQDYVYRDPEMEKERCYSIKYLLAVAEGIINEEFDRNKLEAYLEEIERKYNVHFDRKADARSLGISLYKLIEKRLGETPESDADNLVQLFPWGIKGMKGLTKKYYEQIIRLPFENTTIPVPACYARVLTDRYCDYLKVQKVWSGHGYPYFEGQKSSLQAVADFKLPEFSFNSRMLERPQANLSSGIKAISYEWISENKSMLTVINDALYSKIDYSEFDVDRIYTMLAACQQSAVDYGSYIEQIMGADRKEFIDIVARLESYCEALFGLYNSLDDKDCLAKLNETLSMLENEITRQIIDKQIIAFVIDDVSRFSEIEPLYKRVLYDHSNLVYTIFVRSFFKDIYGNVSDYDKSEEELNYVNLSALTPDTIFFQNPYDEQNPCLTLPSEYYASKMRLITRQLIYLAPKVDEFDFYAVNEIYNMKHYVTVPGVILADKIWIQSENMKEMYVRKLTEFAGEETEKRWRDQIDVRSDIYRLNNDNPAIYTDCCELQTKKKILYCLGENELFEHDVNNLKKAVNKRLELFRRHSEALDVDSCVYPPEIEKDCIDYLADFRHVDYDELKPERINSYDAYYGSPSPVVLQFVRAGKPVMISNYDI